MNKILEMIIKRNVEAAGQRNPALPDDLARLLSIVNEKAQPNLNPLNVVLRDLPAMRWNVKVMGYLMARLLLGTTEIGSLPSSPEPFVPQWRATLSDDFFTDWFRGACKALKIEPVLHRKLWEFGYVLACLEHFGKLKPGARALGFGCGSEPLPSLFAARGLSILATDLAPSAQGAAGWIDSDQHTTDLAAICKPELVAPDVFGAQVSLRHVDMNAIPADLDGGFDICWSICALEHLGSIEQGLAFVRNSLKTLRPGGVAVHTTEFNYSSDEATIDNWGTVLFRKRDFGRLYEELRRDGYELPAVSFDTGNNPIDWFIDIPPFSWQPGYYSADLPALPHLKLSIDGFPSTCFGMVIRKPERT